MSTALFLSNYLTKEAQAALLTDLTNHEKFEQVVDILNSQLVDISDNAKLCRLLFEKLILKISGVIDVIRSSDNHIHQYSEILESDELKTLAELACKLPHVWALYEDWLSEKLVRHSVERKEKLFRGDFYDKVFQQLISEFKTKGDTIAKEYDDVEFIALMKVLELSYTFASEASLISCNKLDAIVIGLLACDDETLANTCSNLIKWRVSQISKKCNRSAIFDLLTLKSLKETFKGKHNGAWQQKIGLTLLLRLLLQTPPSPQLVNFMQTDIWDHIKNALIHDSHEYRKLGLSILKLSIQKSSDNMESFESPLFFWNSSEKIKTIQAWEKFTTLYEIVSLESALNQIQAASDYILELFNDPFLPPTWGLILFSTGLRAPMEGIRKYMMSLLFQVDDPAVFSADIDVLKESILPSAMEAHYFASDGKSCLYGERLVEFVTSVISNSGDQISAILEALLDVLVKYGTSYDPARIYLSYGVLKSLKEKHVRVISLQHLRYIKKLFEFESEEVLFETTIKSIYLKFLLHVDKSVTPVQWIQAIVTHLKCNENNYKYLTPLMDIFKDFAVTYFDPNTAINEISQYISNDPTFEVLSVILFENDSVIINKSFLLELAISNESVNSYAKEATDILSQLLLVEDSTSYKSTSLLLDLSCFSSLTWKSIKLKPLFDSLFSDFCPDKLFFFVAAFKKVTDYSTEFDDLKFTEVKDLYSTIQQQIKKSTSIFFKIRDKTYSAYFDFVLVYMKSHSLEVADLTELLNLLKENIDRDNGNFEGNLQVSNICSYLLENYATFQTQENNNPIFSVFLIVSTMWESITSERLVLKQRSLHLSTINCLFHSKVLHYACLTENHHSNSVSQKLCEYGQDILEQAQSRRGVLPLLSSSICSFIKRYGELLGTKNSKYDWIVYLMASIFAMEQSKVSIFQIKPVIAELYDKNICLYSESKNGLYLDIYKSNEIAAKISVIETLITSPASFKEKFVCRLSELENFLTANRKTDGDEERERLLKWQLFVLCIPDINPIMMLEIAEKMIFNGFLTEFSPSIRVYMEWSIALALAENYEEEAAIFLEDKVFSVMNEHSKPILVVGAERICFIVLKALKGKANIQRFMERFTSTLVSNATSNKPLVRHFSNSLTLSYWPLFQKEIKDKTLRNIFEELYKNAQSQKNEGHYRAGDAILWSLYEDITLTGLFGGVLKKIMDHDLPYITKQQFKTHLQVKNSIPIGEDECDLWVGERVTKPKEKITSNSPPTSSQFQTKSGAWEAMFDIDDNETMRNVKRSELIIVSSLVDKAPNLGGICRLCDVLGVGLLTVQDLRVKNHPQFKRVAVTADRWMPIQEVTVEQITEFMRGKKKEGYTLIGLEQTDQSIKLDENFKFPKKSLILLGIEALGIPGHLLSELDICVEIKQFGVIRSMNIQTATAVIAHSYTVQHM